MTSSVVIRSEGGRKQFQAVQYLALCKCMSRQLLNLKF